MYENLKAYRENDFFCCITLVDRNNNACLLSEGDKIIFGVKPCLTDDPVTGRKPQDIVTKELTADDGIGNKYYFRLSPQETDTMDDNNFYYVSIEFADGGRFQIAPYSCFDVCFPVSIDPFSKNEICCVVPRILYKITNETVNSRITDYVKNVFGSNSHSLVRIMNFSELDIIAVNDNTRPELITVQELEELIAAKAESFESENYIVIGLNFPDEPQRIMKNSLKADLGNRFTDLEEIMKRPVYSGGELTGSHATELAGIEPTENDLLRIAQNQYPESILTDDRHFNDTGYDIIAAILTEEAEQYGM